MGNTQTLAPEFYRLHHWCERARNQAIISTVHQAQMRRLVYETMWSSARGYDQACEDGTAPGGKGWEAGDHEGVRHYTLAATPHDTTSASPPQGCPRGGRAREYDFARSSAARGTSHSLLLVRAPRADVDQGCSNFALAKCDRCQSG